MVKNTKKKGKTSKQNIGMRLIQNQVAGEVPSAADIERDYQNFKKRVFDKSGHAYVDLGEKPILLRILSLGSLFDSTQEMLVMFGSFKVIKGKSGKGKKQEIGFQAELKSNLTPGKTHKLVVMRKQHKATLHIKL